MSYTAKDAFENKISAITKVAHVRHIISSTDIHKQVSGARGRSANGKLNVPSSASKLLSQAVFISDVMRKESQPFSITALSLFSAA